MFVAFLKRPQTEFFIIFFSIPIVMTLIPPRNFIYTVLWIFALLALRMLRNHYKINFKEEWNIAALNKHELRLISLRFLLFAIALTLFTWIQIPEQLFGFPRSAPLIWLGVMIFYPIISVFPQEIIYRSYFFRRYVSWPSGDTQRYLLNCFAFGWIHIVLQNWVAVAFSAIGSLIFTRTYLRTKSLAAVCFEHALYGCYIFSVGLGYYFYHGTALR